MEHHTQHTDGVPFISQMAQQQPRMGQHEHSHPAKKMSIMSKLNAQLTDVNTARVPAEPGMLELPGLPAAASVAPTAHSSHSDDASGRVTKASGGSGNAHNNAAAALPLAEPSLPAPVIAATAHAASQPLSLHSTGRVDEFSNSQAQQVQEAGIPSPPQAAAAATIAAAVEASGAAGGAAAVGSAEGEPSAVSSYWVRQPQASRHSLRPSASGNSCGYGYSGSLLAPAPPVFVRTRRESSFGGSLTLGSTAQRASTAPGGQRPRQQYAHGHDGVVAVVGAGAAAAPLADTASARLLPYPTPPATAPLPGSAAASRRGTAGWPASQHRLHRRQPAPQEPVLQMLLRQTALSGSDIRTLLRSSSSPTRPQPHSAVAPSPLTAFSAAGGSRGSLRGPIRSRELSAPDPAAAAAAVAAAPAASRVRDEAVRRSAPSVLTTVSMEHGANGHSHAVPYSAYGHDGSLAGGSSLVQGPVHHTPALHHLRSGCSLFNTAQEPVSCHEPNPLALQALDDLVTASQAIASTWRRPAAVGLGAAAAPHAHVQGLLPAAAPPGAAAAHAFAGVGAAAGGNSHLRAPAAHTKSWQGGGKIANDQLPFWKYDAHHLALSIPSDCPASVASTLRHRLGRFMHVPHGA